MWLQRGTEPPTKPTLKVGALKVMVTIFWNPERIWLVDELPQRKTMNSQYFTDNVLDLLQVEMDKDCEEQPESVVLHMDNARVHRSKKVREWLDGSLFAECSHPPYSPDLAPSDFFLFSYIKHLLKGFVAATPDELMQRIYKICQEIDPRVLRSSWEHWHVRCAWVIENGGEYYSTK
ncbi:MAG: putative mariner transposase [Streblomastix strix]|uniref:Putative mariner transposase n=1 Tax=Streblomastix strix TaxID=222440 RepID=A0A5J4VCX2_9EUKA|nr:MAG: putative mariner transposase [Streblomastix strix]